MTVVRLIAILAALTGATAIAGPAFAQARPAPAGETLFKQRCANCHTTTAGQRHGLGPNLVGVMGRKPAAAANYNYSQGMRTATAAWTPQTLEPFLAAPTRAVPGTRMTMGVANPADRSAIIAYLQTVR